ncbi:hypothetical protein ACEPAG_877 [Sanghuangporus baumii]
MVGGNSQTSSRPVTDHSADDPNLPSYSEIENDQASPGPGAYMTATTTTTVTTTTQTTTFFSLPLWLRRAGPALSSPAKSEGSQPSALHGRATEDGRIARAISYNIDFNKKLPDIPNSEAAGGPGFARHSTGMMHLPTVQQEIELDTKRARSSRSSTLLSSPGQSTRTLAQAGLGIGLPHVMPSAASTCRTRKVSQSATRPNTAPRPNRLEPSKEVRRVKSFSRAQTVSVLLVPNSEDQENVQFQKKNSTLAVPHSDNPNYVMFGEGEGSANPSDVRFEPKSLVRRASFWNRRRVQSMKSSDEARTQLQQDPRIVPLPTLPVLQPISPMFPDRAVQSSSGSSSRPPSFHASGQLRRRHSERSASTHHSPQDSNFSAEPPPIPVRSPHKSLGSGSSQCTTAHRSSSSLQEPQSHSIQSSFISSPPLSRLPVIYQGQSRPRSMTNPPSVLHRLSMGFFTSSSPSSPISSPSVSTNFLNETPVSSSPRQSRTLPRSSLSTSVLEIPRPREDEESPEVFLERLEAAVSKAEIANILAGSGDSYYSQALRIYIDRFNFTNDPLDIALRKLLMDVGLPKETQQIDRVMEAFAARYSQCNLDLFVSQDHPYILAFSLIMLHTDAFNKSNKRKMTKADYIKNTKLVGVSTEVLDYFFDNIVFAPFIFIEDPFDVNGQRGFTQDGRAHSSGSAEATPTLNGSVLGKSNKVDAYYLITRNLLDGLRIDVETHIPLRNPYSYQGTAGSWNEAELRRSFARAGVIEVDVTDARRLSTLPFFTMNVTGAPGPVVHNVSPPALSDQESMLSEHSSLKVTKVGLLNRKDDLLDGGKRSANRRWKEQSIILTGSQLLFYRDSVVALNLIVQSHSPGCDSFPNQSSFLMPDEIQSVKDAIAVYDSSYAKRDYVVRLVMASGRQILLQTENEIQRNEWIAHINYASAFKTAGIRMRPVSATENARMDRSSYTRDAPLIPSESSSPASDLFDGLLELDNNPIANPDGSSAETQQTQLSPDNSGSNSHSRSRIVLTKIREFESKIESARTQLDSEIRLVHNLAILTPFQRSTRDRLQTSVINLARRIKQLRLDIVKVTCFRDVLAADLASEERERKCRKREESVSTSNWDDGVDVRPRLLPLPIHEGDTLYSAPGQSLSRSDVSDLSHGRPNSSICESFHSALDFGSDWPKNTRPPSYLRRDTTPMQSLEQVSPLCTPSREASTGSPSGSGFFPSQFSAGPSIGDSSSSPSRDRRSGQRMSEEQAEEWNKTRAARRVSLVRVPATLTAMDNKGHKTSFQLTGNEDSLCKADENTPT